MRGGVLGNNFKAQKICDIGAGMGANIYYMHQCYPQNTYVGIEYDGENVIRGNQLLKQYSQNIESEKVSLVQGDWYNLMDGHINQYDGIVSYQTLSWLPGYEKEINCLIKLNPEWIAITSLFYEGNIDYTIKLKEYDYKTDEKDYTECYYNIYSLKKVQEVFKAKGYTVFEYQPFDIDIDIEKPEQEGLGTYTKRLENGKRIQISGGLMLPWYFILARKTEAYITN